MLTEKELEAAIKRITDRLDEVHHEMAPEGLAAAMEMEGYREILRESTDLPNGKKLLRIDFEKED